MFILIHMLFFLILCKRKDASFEFPQLNRPISKYFNMSLLRKQNLRGVIAIFSTFVVRAINTQEKKNNKKCVPSCYRFLVEIACHRFFSDTDIKTETLSVSQYRYSSDIFALK